MRFIVTPPIIDLICAMCGWSAEAGASGAGMTTMFSIGPTSISRSSCLAALPVVSALSFNGNPVLSTANSKFHSTHPKQGFPASAVHAAAF
jgi:hypothetical protein